MSSRSANACNAMDNGNMILQSYLVPETHWVTQSVYFRFENTVELGMGIKDENYLFCNGISEQIRGNKISMREYNDRVVYYCSRTPFPVDYVIPDLNIPPVPLDDSYISNKKPFIPHIILQLPFMFPLETLLVI